MRRALAYPALAALAAVPRLVILLYERDDVLTSFVEKSDTFATTLAESGTYGFVPGVPSAYTQPLYGLLLGGLYATAGRSWPSVGLLNLALAVSTVLLAYELARRVLSPRAGLAAAALVALNPYLVWHDMHLNREVLDGLLAVALTLLVLLAGERGSAWLAAAAGAAAGLGVLGNSRLALLLLALAGFLLWRLADRRRGLAGAAALVFASAAVVTPWVVRNRVELGCFALTTDARALWKANNPNTVDVLASGRWIDAVPAYPGRGLTPEYTGDIYRQTGRIIRVDECEEMRFFQARVLEFWREHPGQKAELAARGAWMLWDPRVSLVAESPGAGTWLDFARTWVAGAFFAGLFLLAALGLARVPRPFAVLAVTLLAYQTLLAIAFVGTTRYRAPWDFVLAVLASATLAVAVDRVRRRERPPAAR